MSMPSAQSRQQAMFCHFLTFCGWIIPLGNLIGPLILWLSQKDKDSFVDYHGKEALNFQITLSICFLLLWIPLSFIGIGIGILLLVLIGIASIILTIRAAIEANRGHTYAYPLTFRFIK